MLPSLTIRLSYSPARGWTHEVRATPEPTTSAQREMIEALAQAVRDAAQIEAHCIEGERDQ